ncbi:MAG: PEP-CTERM sorting domain-containing protein [Planctomycetes bacterium]|nr:PEP-CTERM sorting domain-containing protein [Planctomycetota bacterium]
MKPLKTTTIAVLVMMFLVSAAQAAYFWIDPPSGSTIPATIGESVSYDIYFHTDVADEYWISAWDLIFNYDNSELNVILPSPGAPDFGFFEGLLSPKTLDTDTASGEIEIFGLGGTGIISTGPAGDLLIVSIEFEVVDTIVDGISDLVILDQAGTNNGISAYDFTLSKHLIYRFAGAEGADVVPEPTTVALLSLGALGVILRKRM